MILDRHLKMLMWYKHARTYHTIAETQFPYESNDFLVSCYN